MPGEPWRAKRDHGSGRGTHSATEQFLRRMGSLPVAMLSFASHCDAGNDAVVAYQPTMIPGTSSNGGTSQADSPAKFGSLLPKLIDSNGRRIAKFRRSIR